MNFTFTQLYAIADADPKHIQIDQDFTVVSVVIETLSIAAPPADLDDYDFVANGENDAVLGLTGGVVTLQFSPKGSYRRFDTADNAIDLTDLLISFLTLDVQVDRVFPTITTPIVPGGSGCTHFAITVTGNNGRY